MKIFCPNCNAYFPTGDACPTCGWQRPPLHAPAAPGQPLWRTAIPGQTGAHLLITSLDDAPLLLAGWGFLPRRADTRPQDGGVVALNLNNGSPLWEAALGMPVDGGPILAEESVLVGFGQRGVGGGQGGLAAIDAASGRELWRLSAGGNVRGAPIAAEGLTCFTADDGYLYAVRLSNHEIIWKQPAAAKAASMPASPAWVWMRGQPSGVITGSYSARFGRQPAWLTAFDMRGRVRWRQELRGSVRDQPLVAGRRLFVTAYEEHPSAGVLAAYDVHTGAPLWPEPFRVQATKEDALNHYFVTQPLLHENVLYVGCTNHHLYAVDAASGKLRWQWQGPHGIITRIALAEGLLIFGDTSGVVHALDIETRQEVWVYDLGAPVMAHPLVQEGVIFAGAGDGALAALPWHGGRYAWAAERMEKTQRWDEAGDLWALAAFFHPEQEDEVRPKAIQAWSRAGRWEKAAYYLLASGRKRDALEILMQGGGKLRLRRRAQATDAFWLAHRMAFRLKRFSVAWRSAQHLAELASLPLLQIEARNVGGYTQGEAGRLTLRIENVGKSVAPDGIHFWLGGGLQEDVSYFIPGEIHPGQMLNIPLTITPTAAESVLLVEYRYATGREDMPSLRGVIDIPIAARPPRAKPMQVGDVQQLHVTIAAATEEGVAIETGDIAVFKNQGDIDDIHIEGDAGAVINRGGDIGDVTIGGDAGLVRSSPSSLAPGPPQLATPTIICPSCGLEQPATHSRCQNPRCGEPFIQCPSCGLYQPFDKTNQFCIHCGAQL